MPQCQQTLLGEAKLELWIYTYRMQGVHQLLKHLKCSKSVQLNVMLVANSQWSQFGVSINKKIAQGSALRLQKAQTRTWMSTETLLIAPGQQQKVSSQAMKSPLWNSKSRRVSAKCSEVQAKSMTQVLAMISRCWANYIHPNAKRYSN